MVKASQRIVIKIGTSSLTHDNGNISSEKIQNIVQQTAGLRKGGHQVVLVTSGAIAAGFRSLGYPERPQTVNAKQAAAAVGQGLLIEEYNRYFSALGYIAAQLLLNRSDFTDKRRYQNVYDTLNTLLERGAIPIINENDTVSIEELRFGDNDTLSADVAALLHADLLILLTDVDGLYTADPKRDNQAKHLNRVELIDESLERMAWDTSSKNAMGGMSSKLSAARLATAAGVPVFICCSDDPDVLQGALDSTARGTWFTAVPQYLKTRLQWLAFHSDIKGTLVVDMGASEALKTRHTSLLASGIQEIQGSFQKGDAVEVVDELFNYIGKGIVQYDCNDLEKVLGCNSEEIQRIQPGAAGEVINRDNWLGSERNLGETK